MNLVSNLISTYETYIVKFSKNLPTFDINTITWRSKIPDFRILISILALNNLLLKKISHLTSDEINWFFYLSKCFCAYLSVLYYLPFKYRAFTLPKKLPIQINNFFREILVEMGYLMENNELFTLTDNSIVDMIDGRLFHMIVIISNYNDAILFGNEDIDKINICLWDIIQPNFNSFQPTIILEQLKEKEIFYDEMICEITNLKKNSTTRCLQNIQMNFIEEIIPGLFY